MITNLLDAEWAKLQQFIPPLMSDEHQQQMAFYSGALSALKILHHIGSSAGDVGPGIEGMNNECFTALSALLPEVVKANGGPGVQLWLSKPLDVSKGWS